MRRYRILLILLTALSCSAHITCADDKPEIKSFDSDGVKIAYLTQGRGEPVLLIHGWISSAGINWVLPGTSALLAKDLVKSGMNERPKTRNWH